ncbi:MAG: hypothetical protein LBH00_00180 [Planctomycetaceae bacterium]|jgi:ethanolamine ammonia-lyase large subunit|nr:hypothetical protein [Planctomycetaceae bacterium]
MTRQKIDWSKYNPIPGFDGLKWKEERQAQIYEETKNMTREEFREYLRKGSEEFQKDIAERRKKLGMEN